MDPSLSQSIHSVTHLIPSFDIADKQLKICTALGEPRSGSNIRYRNPSRLKQSCFVFRDNNIHSHMVITLIYV